MRPVVLLGAALLGACALPVHGASDAEVAAMLRLLHDNGHLSDAQYRRLATALASADPAQPSPTARRRGGGTPVVAPSGQGAEVSLGSGGFGVRSADGAYAFSLGGRALVDGALYDADRTPTPDAADLRQARLTFKGRLARSWRVKAQYDFAGNKTKVKDAWLGYAWNRGDDLVRLGQFREPFSLEDQTSSKYITFMERAQPVSLFSPGRNLGLGLAHAGQGWQAAGGLFGESVGAARGGAGQGGAFALRASLAPWHRGGRVLHLGAGLEYRRPNASGTVRYKEPVESAIADVVLVDTGKLDGVSHTWTYGLEAAWVGGPFSLQGEYLGARVERADAYSPGFEGAYVQVAWTLTGEPRRYGSDRGRFTGLRPRGPWGALETALRWSFVDLDDGPVQGGRQDNYGLGLNWYANRNVRLMADYLWVDARTAAGHDRPRLFQVRGQWVF